MQHPNIISTLMLSLLLLNLSDCKSPIQSSNSNETALIQAYLATDYQVYPTLSDTLHIRINQTNKSLDGFLEEHQSWAFITAWNPNSQVLPAAKNKARNQALAKVLNEKGLTYYLGKGVPDEGDWIPEVSFLVVDLSKELALKIGQQYGCMEICSS